MNKWSDGTGGIQQVCVCVSGMCTCARIYARTCEYIHNLYVVRTACFHDIVLRIKDAPIRNSADISITNKLRQILAESNIVIITVYHVINS